MRLRWCRLMLVNGGSRKKKLNFQTEFPDFKEGLRVDTQVNAAVLTEMGSFPREHETCRISEESVRNT